MCCLPPECGDCIVKPVSKFGVNCVVGVRPPLDEDPLSGVFGELLGENKGGCVGHISGDMLHPGTPTPLEGVDRTSGG